MTLGFVMYEYRDRGLRVNKHLSRFLWFTSITMILVIVLVYFQFQQADQYLEFSNIENSLYNAFYRHLWALSIGWIIIGCHNGSGGVIKWFLSHSCFQPIAKMSLSIYLTHRVHQIISIASIRQSIHLNPYEIFQIYLSDVMMSLAIGTVVYLTIEAPFANLESRIFNRRPRK
jgi:peptidoglycan/LPS O-acetylase OafA/YrhL